MPDVSIIMPVYNGEEFIAAAIDSALSQEGVDFELLIGDNASTDRTLEIVRSFRDPRVRLLTSDVGLGVYGNLNRLVEMAAAPVIKVLCADDTILPDGLRRQVEHFARFPGIDFSFCRSLGSNALYARSASRQFASPEEGAIPETLNAEAATLAFLGYGNLVGSLTNAIARRDAILAAGAFNQDFAGAGDFDLWARLAVRSGTVVQKEELVYVREHAGQASRHINARLDMIRQLDAIYGWLFEMIGPRHRTLIRWQASLNLVSQHWNRVVRSRWSASSRAAVWVRRNYAFSNAGCLFLFLVTASRRIACRWPRRWLLARIREVNSASQNHG